MGQPQITQADAIGSAAHRAPGYTLGTAPIQQFGGARHAAPAWAAHKRPSMLQRVFRLLRRVETAAAPFFDAMRGVFN